VGAELSHQTIATITDAVLNEVSAWQHRSLEAINSGLTLQLISVRFIFPTEAFRPLSCGPSSSTAPAPAACPDPPAYGYQFN
jgi:hypothetical protein